MKRRESIKSIIAGSVSGSLLLQGCEPTTAVENENEPVELEPGRGYGRTPEEAKRDDKLMEDTFFMPFEMATIAVVADLIIPADDQSGSATDAGVPDFIEFMVKDYPNFQQPLRSGLAWLNLEAKDRFGVNFKDASKEQQTTILDEIAAAADSTNEEESQKTGTEFFKTIRNLTATGFFTSKMGVVEDLGYVGNVPNVWDGVPEDVLQKHGFSYDEALMDKYVTAEDRNSIPEWDDEGNLVS